MVVSLEREFIDIVREILQSQGYSIDSELRDSYGRYSVRYEPDLLISKNGESIVVESKIYRTSTVSPSVVRNAISQLSVNLEVAGVDRALLIVTTPLDRSRFHLALSSGLIDVWDLGTLSELTRENAKLTADLSSFIRRAGIGTLGRETPSDAVLEIEERASASGNRDGDGDRIAQEIEDCPGGQKSATRFETACAKALKFLFEDQVGRWTPQRASSGGLHRYDLVARLEPKHAFWVGLAHDFRSRYVIFEFKNYAAKIHQEQIYTTEKYLFVPALRTVSIIISRKGADKNALHAARGALRENGKLILIISSQELCQVLRGKDRGDDPTNLLIEKLDDMLTQIER
ncbi:hypothetical protein QFZ27_003202 [Inquilinus ginsengisoli]|uniref:restriction endonuclease n=1 Tax=Inquilinus ginsengisoli TaxID=363840 RepID=UPI003D1E92CD